MNKQFDGKVALVTAAASGIGAAIATAFAREGASVVLSDLNEAGGEEVAEGLRSSGAKARFVKADATVEEDVERIVRTAIDTFGGLSLAANVVGGAPGGANGPELHKKTVAGWDATMSLCLRSVFLGLKHEISHMIEHGGGAIVNVASLAALHYVPESGAAYSAAKAGVIQLTKYAAANYAERGVRVNCIAPGATPTPAYYVRGLEAGKAQLQIMIERQAIKRAVDASEQAAAAVWLCSNAAAMVTGHNIPVDGGWAAL
jgi:NAD(P)-dependent dehydrogenase (short-subunit alcohol dehydrogenase family)